MKVDSEEYNLIDPRTVAEVVNILKRTFPPQDLRQREGSYGKMLDYIDWPAAIHRLDEAVGTNNWDFLVSGLQFVGGDTGYAICQGHLTIRFPDGTISTKGQYGGNAYGKGMSPDDAAKGAGSDALKKCAALFGIALDLADKGQPAQGAARQQQNSGGYSAPSPRANTGGTVSLVCDECGDEIKGGNFGDGKPFTAQQAASWGMNKYGRPLCGRDYKEANNAKRRAEEALQTIPF